MFAFLMFKRARRFQERFGTGLRSLRGSRSAICRIACALLALVHLPVLVSVVGDGVAMDRAGAILALLATVSFFTLKTLCPGVLRLPTRRHGAVALFIVAAIVHHDAVSPALVAEFGPEAQHVAAVLVTSVATYQLWRRRRKSLRRLTSWCMSLARSLARSTRAIVPDVLLCRGDERALCHEIVCAMRIAPRAPPIAV